MYIIVVYDTLAERNPVILRTCRQYLHHVQRSVFEGEVSAAQLRRFQAAIEGAIDKGYDSVLVYTFPPGTRPHHQQWGTGEPMPTDILLRARVENTYYLQQTRRIARTTGGPLQSTALNQARRDT